MNSADNWSGTTTDCSALQRRQTIISAIGFSALSTTENRSCWKARPASAVERNEIVIREIVCAETGTRSAADRAAPRATDGTSRIVATEAELQQRTNDLTLNGVVELERGDKDADASNADTTLRTGQAQESRQRHFAGEGSSARSCRDEEETLEQLEGLNLVAHIRDITVQAPVNVQHEKGVLRAQDTNGTSVNRPSQRASFEADLDEAQIFKGDSKRISSTPRSMFCRIGGLNNQKG